MNDSKFTINTRVFLHETSIQFFPVKFDIRVNKFFDPNFTNKTTFHLFSFHQFQSKFQGVKMLKLSVLFFVNLLPYFLVDSQSVSGVCYCVPTGSCVVNPTPPPNSTGELNSMKFSIFSFYVLNVSDGTGMLDTRTLKVSH
jgi:hypothetical protein